jgi:hypothetical protein
MSTMSLACPIVVRSVRVYATQSSGANGNKFLWEINSSPSDPTTYTNSLTVSSALCGLLTTLSVPDGYYLHIACDDGASTRYAFTNTTVITAGVPTCPSDLGNACAANIQITQNNTCITFVTNAADNLC